MLSLREVYDASHVTREKFEAHVISADYVASLWGAAMEEDVAYAASVLRIFPCGSCDFSSRVLRKVIGGGALIQGSYENEMYGELGKDPHSFLLVETYDAGEVMADITADQFAGPAIYVGKLVLPWSVQSVM